MSASALDYNLKIENKKHCDILALRPLFSGWGELDLASFKLVLIIQKPKGSYTAKIPSENSFYFYFLFFFIFKGLILLFFDSERERPVLPLISLSPQENAVLVPPSSWKSYRSLF